MNPMWGIALLMVGFLIIVRLRFRKSRGKPKVEVYARRIDGNQVNAYLRPEISNACLFDNGVQFGRGFRRKEGPNLPHDEFCGCRASKFSFTSTEVFNGALREFGEIESTMPDLPQEAAKQLIECLKRLNGLPLPSERETYLTLAELQNYSGNLRPGIEEFLSSRYAFLSAGGGGNAQALTHNESPPKDEETVKST